MTKREAAAGLLFILVMTALGLGLWWSFFRETHIGRKPEPTRPISRTNLGVVYVPVTTKTAYYYGLDIDSGALVTEVLPGSPADEARLQPGDVIMSFNGTVLEEGVSLARLLIECATGHGGSTHRVNIQAWRGGCMHSIELWHIPGGAN